jgi:hypothetical protein
MSPAASAGAANAAALAQTAIVISIRFIAVLLEGKGGILSSGSRKNRRGIFYNIL